MDFGLIFARLLGSYFVASLIFYPAYMIKKHKAEDPEDVSYNTLGSIIVTAIAFFLSF